MNIRKHVLLALSVCIAQPATSQSYGQVPTVRYEGRPVEDIVKDGVPVRNYDGDGRVIVDRREQRNMPANIH